MNMGIGDIGAPAVIIKRKFRWTFEIDTPNKQKVPIHYVKVANRPSLEIEESEINFLNATTWIPGKAKWQPLSVTYVDVQNKEMKPLYDWILSLYDFNSNTELFCTEKAGWNATAILKMYDGCGNPLEQWSLSNCWPTSVNFGDLDYSSSEEATIELSLRYSSVLYVNHCGETPKGNCSGCIATSPP